MPTSHLQILLKFGFWLGRPILLGLQFCISNKLPGDAVLLVVDLTLSHKKSFKVSCCPRVLGKVSRVQYENFLTDITWAVGQWQNVSQSPCHWRWCSFFCYFKLSNTQSPLDVFGMQYNLFILPCVNQEQMMFKCQYLIEYAFCDFRYF